MKLLKADAPIEESTIVSLDTSYKAKPDKTIITRLCSCGNCRFHNIKEPGWETCPNKPIWGMKNAHHLWGINPEWLRGVSDGEIMVDLATANVSANIAPISPEDK